MIWDTPIGGDWTYDRVSHRGAGDITFELDAGAHELYIERREDGTQLDRLLITNDRGFAPTYVPMTAVVGDLGGRY